MTGKRLSDAELQKIVSAQRPGFEVIPTPALYAHSDTGDTMERSVNSTAVDIGYLRQKFLGSRTDAAAASRTAPSPAGDKSEAIVQIRPAHDTTTKSKAAVVSGRSKKIVGEQG